MDRERTPPPPFRGATSSPMLTLSSSARSQLRRYSSAVYSPPMPRYTSPSASPSSSSRLQSHRHQIPPPPSPRVEERLGRARGVTTPPSLSELAEIRRARATLSAADLDAPARSNHRNASSSSTMNIPRRGSFSSFTPPPPSTTGMMPSRGFSSSLPASSSHRRQQPGGFFSGFPSPAFQNDLAPPVFRRQMPPSSTTSTTGTPPLFPAGILSSSESPSRVSSSSQQQQQQAARQSLSIRVAPLPGGFGCGLVLSSDPSPSPPLVQQDQQTTSGSSRIFAGSAPPPASSLQQLPAKASSFTDLAPLPSGCGFSDLITPRSAGEDTTGMFGSSSWPSAAATTSDTTMTTTMYGQPSSGSELPPFPPSLQMQPPEDHNQAPSIYQSSANNDYYSTDTTTSALYGSTESAVETTRLLQQQVPTTTHHRLLQVKEEPVVDHDAPCMEPVFIALDGDDDDGLLLSSLLDSIQSSDEPAPSHPNNPAPPLSSQGWLHPDGTNGLGDVNGSGQSWDLEAMLLTPAPTMYDNNQLVNDAGVSSGASFFNEIISGDASGSIPMNCDGGSMSSMSQQQQQIPPQQGDHFSMDLSADWQQLMSQNSLQVPLLPTSTDMQLQLNNPDIWNTAAGADTTGQDWAGTLALTNMFHHMSIIGQGAPAAPATAGQYDMLNCDSSGNSSSSNAWPGMHSLFPTNLDQMGTSGGGSMSIGQGFQAVTPPVPPPTFDITGSSSSSSAWASMRFNYTNSTMGSSIPSSEPKLRLGGMEKPSRLPRWITPSNFPGASSSMSRRSAYGDFFSEAEMVMINKDKHLKQMVNTDAKRVKRILNNRASVAKLKLRRHAEFLDLS